MIEKIIDIDTLDKHVRRLDNCASILYEIALNAVDGDVQSASIFGAQDLMELIAADFQGVIDAAREVQ